jgi:hypothetical protein
LPCSRFSPWEKKEAQKGKAQPMDEAFDKVRKTLKGDDR